MQGISNLRREVRRVGLMDAGSMAWIPVSAARVQLGVSKQRVHQLIRGGRLVARDVMGTILVSQRSIEARIALLEKEG